MAVGFETIMKDELSYLKKLIKKAKQKEIELGKEYKADNNLLNYKLREKQYLVNSIKSEVSKYCFSLNL